MLKKFFICARKRWLDLLHKKDTNCLFIICNVENCMLHQFGKDILITITYNELMK